jgi:hypothetical protein
MHQSFSIAVLTVGAIAVLVAYALGSFASMAAPAAPWLLAIGATLVLTGLGLLGAGPRAPRLAAAVLVASASTLMGFSVALALAPHRAGGPLLLGLPRATALMLVLTGGIPLVLLPLAYAWAFPSEVEVAAHAEAEHDPAPVVPRDA